MEFRIADTFTDSLGRLTADEQKAAKTTAFDLQLNPAQPGHQFHRLDRARDRNFWSVRVSSDLRLIVHRTDASLLLCYVDHHDKAYGWAERRKLEVHPRTGAAQLVEIRETIKEIIVPVYVHEERKRAGPPPPLARFSEDELLAYGVPAEWMADVRAASEDGLLTVVEHLPAEAAEALLELATGGRPKAPEPAPAAQNPFDHPDAQRRFRVMTNVEELQRALEYPSQRSEPIVDAELRFDVRTASPRRSSKVHVQPQWIELAYGLLADKRSNIQFGIGAALPYGSPGMKNDGVLDVVAGVWCACRPWVVAALGQTQ